MISESFLNCLNSCAPDLRTAGKKFSSSWICNWAAVSTSEQKNDLKCNIKHDDSSTQNKNTAITWLPLFGLLPDNPNLIRNFISKCVWCLRRPFLLRCNYNIRSFLKLSSFHEQLLLCWSLVHKHNFSHHKCYIWNNQDICFKHKSLFSKKWVDNGIYLSGSCLTRRVTHLHMMNSYQNFTFLYSWEILLLSSMLFQQVWKCCCPLLPQMFSSNAVIWIIYRKFGSFFEYQN